MESTFHIRLTYSGSLRQQNADERNVGNKRRKTDSACTQSVDIHKVEGETFTRTSSLKSQKDCFDYVKLLIEKVVLQLYAFVPPYSLSLCELECEITTNTILESVGCFLNHVNRLLF